MGGSFAHILLLLSLMLGAQATNSEVADCTPFGKATQQCNFVGTSRKPLGLPQADWAMPGTSFAEVRPVDHSPYHAGQSGRWAVSIPPENQVNTQPWDDISFMAVGSRHRLTPAPPVAVFDNPAAAIDPDEEEFPDTTTAESEDSDSEDPNWQLSALFATNGQVAQIQVNLVSHALQRHQIAQALGWNDAEIVNIHQVRVRPKDLVEQRVLVRLIQHTRDPPSHSDMRLVLLDITLHPPAPRRDAQYFRVACTVMEQITIQQLLTVLRLRNFCAYTRLPCLAWRNEVYWSLHSDEVVSLVSGDYLRLEIAPPNDEQGCCDTRCLITMMEEGYDPEHGIIYQTIVDEIYWWRIPSRVLRIHQPIEGDETAMLQLTAHFLSPKHTHSSDQPAKGRQENVQATAPKPLTSVPIVTRRCPGIQATPGNQNALDTPTKGGSVPDPHPPVPTERVGEATNPGPIIGTTNPCGALGKASMFDNLPGEDPEPRIWGIAETHLTSVGLTRFRQELKHQQTSWRVIHGAPAEPVSQSIGAIGGRHTGVAVLSNSPIRALATSWDDQAWKTSRICACAIHVQSQWIKMGCFYGFARDAHTRATKDKTDSLLQHLTDRIVLQARGYRVIVGDFNALTSDLPQFALWEKYGFRELQEIAATRWNRPIANTCKGNSVKDHVWVSPELADKLLEVHTCDSYFPDHAIVYGKFADFTPPIPVKIWYKPHPIPWESIPADHAWPECLPVGQTVPDVFRILEDEADRALRSHTKHGLLQCQRGRSTVTAPKRACTGITPPKPSRKHEYQIQYMGESFQHTLWTRQLRRLQSYVKLVTKEREQIASIHHRETLWQSIRSATGFPGGFPKMWINRSFILPGAPVHLPKHPPAHAEGLAIFTAFKLEFQALEKALIAKRSQAAKARRLDDPNVIYADVGKGRALPVQSVVTQTHAEVVEVSEDGMTLTYCPAQFDTEQEVCCANGWLRIQQHTPGSIILGAEHSLEVGDTLHQDKMKGTPQEVFKAFEDLWNPMWNRHVEDPPTRWDGFVHQLLDTPAVATPMALQPITGESWRTAVKQKKARTSTGPDGVSRTDLLRMPPKLTEQLVQHIQAFEQGVQQWPQETLVGHITAVEKKEGASSPADFRPITVLTLPYRT